VYHTDNMFYLGFRLKLDIAVLNSQLPKAQMIRLVYPLNKFIITIILFVKDIHNYGNCMM